jgi:tight adherence protein B
VTATALGYGGAALVGLALATALGFELSNPSGLVRTAWARYESYLENQLKLLFSETPASSIIFGQLAGGAACVGLAILLEAPIILAGLVVVAIAPRVMLERRRAERVQKIEMQLETWLLILANALKATPSLGDAMASSTHIVRAPIREELELVLKEVNLGTALDEALMNMSGRLQSRTVSGALTTILVGRQTGGDLPHILEETSATLREIERLEGVVRTKTAEGKSQAVVLAVIPFFLLGAIHYIDPNWLRPLTAGAVGYAVLVVAGVLWVGAIWLARKILAVDV